MKPKYVVWMLCLHAGLLILASTRFTIVSWMWAARSWTFDYLQYSYRNGWGYTYQSDYSFAVVLAYVAAYAIGIAAYAMARPYTGAGWAMLGLVLCLPGLISFSIEGSHWLWSHHLSCILSCPAACLLLAVVVALVLVRKKDEPVKLNTKGV